MLAHGGGMSWSDVVAVWVLWWVDEQVGHPRGLHNLVQAGFFRRSSKASLVFPDGEVFIYDTPPPLGALPGGRRGRQTHVHGGSCR